MRVAALLQLTWATLPGTGDAGYDSIGQSCGEPIAQARPSQRAQRSGCLDSQESRCLRYVLIPRVIDVIVMRSDRSKYNKVVTAKVIMGYNCVLSNEWMRCTML